MRNNILSFLIALSVALSLLGAKQMLKSEQSGRAQASPLSAEAGQMHKNIRTEILKDISYNPDHVLDLEGQDILDALREPSLIRRDLPTVIWQYRSAQCVLDVFFKTASGDAQKEKPVHYELRLRDEKREDEAALSGCMKDIARSQTGLRMMSVSEIYKSL